MLHVKYRLVQERGDVFVVQAVEHLASAPLADHETHVTQHTQLVGYRGLRHPDRGDNVCDGLRFVA